MSGLPDDYGWALLSALVLGVTCIAIGFAAGMRRGEVFPEEYLQREFGEQHLRELGYEIAKGGYPDTGSGLYSAKLTYKQWYDLNNAQRTHYNFLEWLTVNILMVLVGGLYFPIVAAALGLGIVIARIVYTIGYQLRGPAGRGVGALLNDLVSVVQLIFAVWAAVKFIIGDPFIQQAQ